MDPWSNGYYSRHIREASMEMEGLPEVIPPSGRVPGHRLLAAPILKLRRRRYREALVENRPLDMSKGHGSNTNRFYWPNRTGSWLRALEPVPVVAPQPSGDLPA